MSQYMPPPGATASQSWEAMQSLFASQGLPPPPIPEHLAEHLVAHTPQIFATRDVHVSPYVLEAYRTELQGQPAISDYVVAGFDGHGANSWAVHHFVVTSSLALFLQLSWGGAYDDEREDREEIAAMFAWASALQDLIAQAAAKRLIPPGWRLEIVATHLGDSGWRWVKPGNEAAGMGLNPSQAMKSVLLDLLSGVVSGTVDLQASAVRGTEE